jgi:hypothetical protein
MKFAMDHTMRRLPAAAVERYANAAPMAAAAANLHRFVDCTPDIKVFYGAEAGEQV